MSFNHKRKEYRRFKQFIPLYLMMVPGIIYLIINNYMPLFGLQLAFKQFKFPLGIWESPFVGLKNFTYLFKTSDAALLFRNTIGYNFVFLFLNTVLAIAVAILLNGIRSMRVKKVTQVLILIPFFLSYVVIGYIVFAMLGEDTGAINNSIVKLIGGEPVSWYSDPKYWPVILTLVQAWKNLGYNSIIYYATIIGFDPVYYEAAMVDGANAWQRIKKITLPMLKPTIIILTLMGLGRVFYTDFGLFYQVPMNSGMLQSVTTTIDTYVYRGLLENNDIGRASAAGFLQSILGFVLVFTANMIVRKIDKDEALF